jgi:hypothetical protein
MMYLQLAIAADVIPEDDESKGWREGGGGATTRLWWGEISCCWHGRRAKPYISEVK